MERHRADEAATEQLVAQRLRQQQDAAREKYLDRDDRDDRQHQRFDKRQHERERD
jgi:hypothetical protein